MHARHRPVAPHSSRVDNPGVSERPLVVVLGSAAHLAQELVSARENGLRLVDGWWGGEGDVCTGVVARPEDAAAALLAAVGGAGLVADVRAPDDLVDRFCDDLRRFGRVEVLTPASPLRPRLTKTQSELLRLVAGGRTVGEAARELGITRRTADRRLAEARTVLGVDTTAEAVVAFSRV
jgi:DNA-binding CsgD family transcriptional regulator